MLSLHFASISDTTLPPPSLTPPPSLPYSTRRLEHVFNDLAKQHYADEIERVNRHMEIANQETEVVRRALP